jgi:hypothetical protein
MGRNAVEKLALAADGDFACRRIQSERLAVIVKKKSKSYE